MPHQRPFNPIEIPNIALNLALEVLNQPVHALSPCPKPVGAGVYLLYYCGELEEYAAFRAVNSKQNPKHPIYIGQADRKGKRKGLIFAPGLGSEIRNRPGNHLKSINAAVICSRPISFVATS